MKHKKNEEITNAKMNDKDRKKFNDRTNERMNDGTEKKKSKNKSA